MHDEFAHREDFDAGHDGAGYHQDKPLGKHPKDWTRDGHCHGRNGRILYRGRDKEDDDRWDKKPSRCESRQGNPCVPRLHRREAFSFVHVSFPWVLGSHVVSLCCEFEEEVFDDGVVGGERVELGAEVGDPVRFGRRASLGDAGVVGGTWGLDDARVAVCREVVGNDGGGSFFSFSFNFG